MAWPPGLPALDELAAKIREAPRLSQEEQKELHAVCWYVVELQHGGKLTPEEWSLVHPALVQSTPDPAEIASAYPRFLVSFGHFLDGAITAAAAPPGPSRTRAKLDLELIRRAVELHEAWQVLDYTPSWIALPALHRLLSPLCAFRDAFDALLASWGFIRTIEVRTDLALRFRREMPEGFIRAGYPSPAVPDERVNEFAAIRRMLPVPLTGPPPPTGDGGRGRRETRTGAPPRGRPPRLDADKERNQWLYEQACKGKLAYRAISINLKSEAARRGWNQVEANRVRQIAMEHTEKYGLPAPPPRRRKCN